MICEPIIAKFLLITSILFITVSSLENLPTEMVYAQSDFDNMMQQNIDNMMQLGR